MSAWQRRACDGRGFSAAQVLQHYGREMWSQGRGTRDACRAIRMPHQRLRGVGGSGVIKRGSAGGFNNNGRQLWWRPLC